MSLTSTFADASFPSSCVLVTVWICAHHRVRCFAGEQIGHSIWGSLLALELTSVLASTFADASSLDPDFKFAVRAI